MADSGLDETRHSHDNNQQFHIRVRKGDWEVEVSAPDEEFVLRESERLIEQFKHNSSASFIPLTASVQSEGSPSSDAQTRTVKPQSLNEFFRQFKLQTHLDKIQVLGYWCEIRQSQPHFSSDDILAKYREVREPPPANIRRDLSSLVSKGLLLSEGKSEDGTLAYALTQTGINEVEAKLPPA